MKHQKKIQCMLAYLIVFLYTNIAMSTQNRQHYDEKHNHHVICSYKLQPKNRATLDKSNELVHTATQEIKDYFEKRKSESIEQSKFYPKHKDSIFFIHFDYDFGHWTLYKPSWISFDDFVSIAKKIYTKHKLNVIFNKEKTVCISHIDLGLNSDYLSLQELEEYKKITANDLMLIDENKKNIWKNLFWHLQIPTTGLLPGGQFEIDNSYKPLAWHFLLWDLAPKKGAGAQVAIIDTGVSAFNIKEEQFADQYKKNINVIMPYNLQNYGYNLVSEHGLDPIRQIAMHFGRYCDHVKFDVDECMEQLPKWIINLIEAEETIQIEQFLCKNAKCDLLSADKQSLNKKGEEALKDLLYGEYGVAPKNPQERLTVINLDYPYNKRCLLETLPAPLIIDDQDPFAAGHGTFTQGIVNAKQDNNKQGIFGLAPCADVVMIKAFHDNGTTNKTTLNAALQRALALKTPIVSMSLKITDKINKKEDVLLNKLVDSIDYVVAASGNDGNDPVLKYMEAYPAKFDSVAFDVGAFKYDQGTYPICSFTQKEKNIGPKFVAPGFDIFSCGLTPHQKDDSMYVFMAGTSVAVPIVTGFLALVLAEFQDSFTREEILKVIYKFSIKLNSDQDWQQGIILGTVDMRSCLLCLHVLQACRTMLDDHPELKYNFSDHINNLIQAVYTINYYIPSLYQAQFGCSLMNDFSKYHAAAQTNTQITNSTFCCIPKKSDTIQADITSTVDCIVEKIKAALELQLTNKKQLSHKQAQKVTDQDMLLLIKNILFTKKINIFSHVSKPFQSRINAALAPKIKLPLMTTI